MLLVHWLRYSATHFRVDVWHFSLFLCSGRKRYKKKSHTIIIACEAFVTHPNWRTPGYRNIYVQNLSVQKSRPHLCAGEPTKPWIMSQEYHSFMFLGPLWSTTDRNTKLTAHTASYSHSAHKTMSSPLWQTKDPASGPLFRPVNAVNRSILYSLKIHFNIILLSMHLCCHKSYLPLPAFILCQMSRQTLKCGIVVLYRRRYRPNSNFVVIWVNVLRILLLLTSWKSSCLASPWPSYSSLCMFIIVCYHHPFYTQRSLCSYWYYTLQICLWLP